MYGFEVVTELMRIMSEYPNFLVIMGGYKDMIKESLFKNQKGLKRRFMWIFDIKQPSAQMLLEIFKREIKKEEWFYNFSDTDVLEFFKENYDKFPSFGGDIATLTFYCKLNYSESQFNSSTATKLEEKTITFPIITSAFNDLYLPNKCSDDDHDGMSAGARSMFS